MNNREKRLQQCKINDIAQLLIAKVNPAFDVIRPESDKMRFCRNRSNICTQNALSKFRRV